MANEEIKSTEIENKAYELAYLITPALTDDKAVASVAEIIKQIETLGGSLVAQDGPEMRDLAYTISIVHTGKRTDYDSAYFGWIRFELSSKSQNEFKEWISTNKDIVRSLILSVSKSIPVTTIKKVYRKSAVAKDSVAEDKVELTSEEIDKQVEELIAETV